MRYGINEADTSEGFNYYSLNQIQGAVTANIRLQNTTSFAFDNQLNSVKGFTNLAGSTTLPVTNQTSPSAPATVAVFTRQMSNLLATITPLISGKLEITVSGQTSSNTLNDGCSTDVRIGTTLLAEGASAGNTLVGVPINATSPTNNAVIPFSKTVQVSGLVIGTKEFIQIGKQIITGGTCSWSGINVSVKEIS